MARTKVGGVVVSQVLQGGTRQASRLLTGIRGDRDHIS
jgi:hypothetical protein